MAEKVAHASHDGGSQFVLEPECPDCIRAVNSHAQLIAALGRFTAEHQRHRWQGKGLCPCGLCHDARAVIKEAKK